MRIYFTLLFTIISLSAFAKNIITGTVVEASDRSPIVGANVLIKDSNGKMLTYGISDDGGRFSIETPDGAENLYIQVTMIGYKTFSAPCKVNAQPWTILMEEGALQLQEVVERPTASVRTATP